MFFDNIRMGAAGGGGGPVTVSNTDSPVDGSTSSTFTFSSAALGTAAAGRIIVVEVAGSESSAGDRTVSAITIGGVSAAKVTGESGVTDKLCEMWDAVVPTGTTGDIVVTVAGGDLNGCGCIVWAIYDADPATNDAQNDSSVTTDAVSVSINVPANGVLVAGSFCNENRTMTFAGVDEDIDESITGDYEHAGGSKAYTAEQVGLTCSATSSGTTAVSILNAASYGPA